MSAATDPYASLAKPLKPPPIKGGDPYASLALPLSSSVSTTPAVDVTAGPDNKEGLYKMRSPKGEIVSVPYTKVTTVAYPNGYTFADRAEYDKFAKDFGADQRIQSGIRPLTERERFEMTYPVGVHGEGVGDNLYNMAQNAGVGIWNTIAHPIKTVQSALASVMPQSLVDDALENFRKDVIEKWQKEHPDQPPPADLQKKWIEEEQLAATPNPLRGMYEAATTGHLGEVLPQAAGSAIATMGIAKSPEVIAEGAESVAPLKAVRPVEVPIGEETVPVLKSEAAPETRSGQLTADVKASGVGAPKFKKFSAEQQAAVKRVIRNVARQTSDLVGPVSEEPSAALQDAATATFAKAKPMYDALDEELITVPGDLHTVSAVVKKAIQRAKNLGYDFDAQAEMHEGETPLGLGKRLSESSQPFAVFQRIRSELGKMRAASSDEAFRHTVSEEMQNMTAQMDKALDNTGLKDTWKEADRLWAKGYALRDTADAFYKATRGTPAAAQAPGLSPIPTKIEGPSLVSRLNDLEQVGVLDRGFSSTEKANLRQSADILDRARAGVGMDTAMLPGHTYSLHSLLWRTLLRLPAIPLVKAMTTTSGAKALAAADAAESTAGMEKALASLYTGMVNGSKSPEDKVAIRAWWKQAKSELQTVSQ